MMYMIYLLINLSDLEQSPMARVHAPTAHVRAALCVRWPRWHTLQSDTCNIERPTCRCAANRPWECLSCHSSRVSTCPGQHELLFSFPAQQKILGRIGQKNGIQEYCCVLKISRNLQSSQYFCIYRGLRGSQGGIGRFGFRPWSSPS